MRVTAGALNNTDIWTREGAFGTAANPDAVVGWKGVPLDVLRIQGIDIAGRVAVAGNGVDAAWIDRRVIVDPAARYVDGLPADIVGSEVDGGFAEFHLCAADQLHDVADSLLTDAQLACLPTAYGTALRDDRASPDLLRRAGPRHGVVRWSGMAAIQLLVDRGREVVARTSAEHRELIAALGVAEVSARGADNGASLALADAVVDVVGVGGEEEFGALVHRLRDRG